MSEHSVEEIGGERMRGSILASSQFGDLGSYLSLTTELVACNR
jgi:hypothetical protein